MTRMEPEVAADDLAASAQSVPARIRALEIEATFVALSAIRRHLDALELAAYDHWKSAGLTYADMGDPIGIPRQNIHRRIKLLRKK